MNKKENKESKGINVTKDQVNELSDLLNISLKQGEDLMDLVEELYFGFYMACEILNEHFPADDLWEDIIMSDYTETKKKMYS